MAEPITTIVAAIFLEALADRVSGYATDELLNKLKGKNTRNAFNKALEKAINSYSQTGNRTDLASTLRENNSILTKRDIIDELLKALPFSNVEPSYTAIGTRWRNAIDAPHQWRNFEDEARIFVDCFKQQLQQSEIFQPLFQTSNLQDIVDLLKIIVDHLSANEVERLNDLKRRNYSFETYMHERARDFVGRQWVFKQIHDFITRNPRGYFFLLGDPGVGKTSLAARLVQQQNYIHHFNSLPMNTGQTSTFLNSICAKLMLKYDLMDDFPVDLEDSSRFLLELLGKVSSLTTRSAPCVIVVDALDETDMSKVPLGANILCLPISLPPNIYIVATVRKDAKSYLPYTECERETFSIDAKSPLNVADIAAYVQGWLTKPSINAFISRNKLDSETFVNSLVTKSEGNFMYITHILPEILEVSDIRQDLDFASLPVGLVAYYEYHWKRMKSASSLEVWTNYKLPVLAALTVAYRQISVDLLCLFSGVETIKVQLVINEWQQFLDVTITDGIKKYRIYHQSYHQFIADQDEVHAVRPSIQDRVVQVLRNHRSK